MIRAAGISEDGVYRYWLTRRWGEGPRICFCQLNPSWADGMKEDPTLNRNISFGKAWGFGEAIIVNLYAFRTEDPKELIAAQKRGVNVVGPENWFHLVYAFASSSQIIACWGAAPWAQQRARDVLHEFRDKNFYCIRRTKSGAPEHPLYLPGHLTPSLYQGVLESVT